nr:hypothetical protein [Tanacetum cinerariifolium]
FVVGVSEEEHGESWESGGVEQEVGKRGRIAWRKNGLSATVASFKRGEDNTVWFFGVLQV